MRWYMATVMHDTGVFNLRIYATTKTQAINMVCKAEGCPPCAIENIRRV